MVATADAILAAVVAEPGCDLHRLAYADWLEEHGDDARAEFVRVQCELARLGNPGPPACGGYYCDVSGDGHALHRGCRPQRLRVREGELFRSGWRGWIPPAFPRPLPGGWSLAFRRGFVAEVALPCAAWLAHGPALVRAAPLGRVTLSDKAPFMSGWERYGGPTPLSWQVPAPLYRLLRGRSHDGEKRYRDDAAALAALSGACLAWARAAAVAPPPPAGV